MHDLTDARPDPQRAKLLMTTMKDQLYRSYCYLLSHLQSMNGINFSAINSNLTTLLEQPKCNALAHLLHHALKQAILKQDEQKLDLTLKALCVEQLYASPELNVSLFQDAYPDSDLARPLVNQYIQEKDKAHQHETLRRFGFTMLAPEKASRSIWAVRKALKAIQVCAPTLYAEIASIVDQIVLVQSDRLHAFSSFYSLGNVYLSELKPHEHWTRYFEHIVHEAAHHHLFMLWTHDEILVNQANEGRFFSPFRREKRPMAGVYHAMFVLARTIFALEKLKNHPKYAGIAQAIQTNINDAGTDSPFEYRFNKVFQVIKDQATLTPFGEKLLHSAQQLNQGATS